MDKILDTLTSKVEQVEHLVETLRGDNAALEARLKQAEEERERWMGNARQARERIESLMSRLPEQI